MILKITTLMLVVGTAVVFGLSSMPISTLAEPNPSDRYQHLRTARSANQKQTIKRFEKRVKEYVRLRERVARRLPHVSKESKPEQIEAHKAAFEDGVRKARTNLKPGYIFSKDIADYIRATIKSEFKGTDRKELRETVLEADTKGVPIRVNYPYPEAKELTEMPATLLLKLPQIPKHVQYRFVKRHLLLVDRENGLIVDYMLNALP